MIGLNENPQKEKRTNTGSGRAAVVDYAALLSILLTALYFGVLYILCGMTVSYDTAVNGLIVNGDMIGYPNSHLFFINHAIGVVLAALYNVFPSWNWYTLFLLLTLAFGLWIVLYRVLGTIGNEKPLKQLICGLPIVFLFDYIFFYDIIYLGFFQIFIGYISVFSETRIILRRYHFKKAHDLFGFDLGCDLLKLRTLDQHIIFSFFGSFADLNNTPAGDFFCPFANEVISRISE